MLNYLRFALVFCLVESWSIYYIIILGNKWEWLYGKKYLKENWHCIPTFTFMLLMSQMSDIVLKEAWEICFLLYSECHISMHRKPGKAGVRGECCTGGCRMNLQNLRLPAQILHNFEVMIMLWKEEGVMGLLFSPGWTFRKMLMAKKKKKFPLLGMALFPVNKLSLLLLKQL